MRANVASGAILLSMLLPCAVFAQGPASTAAKPSGDRNASTVDATPPAAPKATADDDPLSFLNDTSTTAKAPTAPALGTSKEGAAAKADDGVPDLTPSAAPSAAESESLPVGQASSTPDQSPEAAEKRPTHGIGIEEIVVTAQKREESINTVPIAITAYSGDTLKQLGVKDTQSLARLVPGFSANENGGQSTIF